MKIKSISINRLEAYQRKAPDTAEFTAKVCLVGGSTYPADINIAIPEEMLEPIVGIIAQATARAMSEATEVFHADVKAMLAGPAIEQAAITSQSEAVQ